MRVLFSLAMLGMLFGATASPVMVERQLTTTAMTTLQAVALIKEYDLTAWCVTWLASVPATKKFEPISGERLIDRRDAVKRAVVRPAALTLFTAETVTQACDVVVDGGE